MKRKSIADTVREAIAGPVMDIVGPMRTPVIHTPMIGRTTFGPQYGPPVNRKALVENMSLAVMSSDGNERLSTAKFTFFEQIDIHEQDRITLNGVTTTVVKVGGLLDETGKPYLPEAWTGRWQ